MIVRTKILRVCREFLCVHGMVLRFGRQAL
jgi:hypothetical protein